MDEHFSLYVSPINLDPDAPAMPISHPSVLRDLSREEASARIATLGLAEDTWALNEGVTDDGTFLQQTYDIDRERETMFFAALDRLRARQRSSACSTPPIASSTCSGATSTPAHPAAPRPRDRRAQGNAIRDLYRHNDALVGRVRDAAAATATC